MVWFERVFYISIFDCLLLIIIKWLKVYQAVDWKAAAGLLQGIYLTLWGHPYIASMPNLKSLIGTCQVIEFEDFVWISNLIRQLKNWAIINMMVIYTWSNLVSSCWWGVVNFVIWSPRSFIKTSWASSAKFLFHCVSTYCITGIKRFS